MKCFIVIAALVAVAVAKPGVTHGAVFAPLTYAHVVPGAPIGADGRVVDTPEVSVAKAAHAAAHVNEKVTLAHEASKNFAAYSSVVPAAAYSTYAAHVSPVVSTYTGPAVAYGKVYSGVGPVVSAYASGYVPALAYGAPLSLDGRVVDTHEVAAAKAAHFAAHAEAKARLGYAAPAVSVW